jgi:hypothetical protein
MRIAGALMVQACDAIIERGKEIAAHLLEVAVTDMAFDDGNFTVVGTDRTISLFDVAARIVAASYAPRKIFAAAYRPIRPAAPSPRWKSIPIPVRYPSKPGPRSTMWGASSIR